MTTWSGTVELVVELVLSMFKTQTSVLSMNSGHEYSEKNNKRYTFIHILFTYILRVYVLTA